MIRRFRMTVAHLKKQMDRRFTRLQRAMNARFTGVDQRFVSVDQRFDVLDRRFGDMSRRSDARFASLERHLVSLSEKLESIARTLDTKMNEQFKAVHEHENRITDLEAAERARSRAAE
jgi:hypothetical protein